MTNLQILNASGKCGIDDSGIMDLNLIKLDSSYNKKITKLNHMSKLIKLNASSICGITDDSIKNLNLIKLIAINNPNITNVNHMTRLRKLYACGKQCGIDNDGINKLTNLTYLETSDNARIKKIN